MVVLRGAAAAAAFVAAFLVGLCCAGCTTRPPLTASQLAPAKNVEPIRVDHPEFWQTLAAWESEGDCASMVHLHGQLDALVEELAAAYNRAAKRDPLHHAKEVLENKLTDALLRELSAPDTRPGPGLARLNPAAMTIHDLAFHLAYFKGSEAAVRRAWWRTCGHEP